MADIPVSNLIVSVTSEQSSFASSADSTTNALRKQKQAAKEASKSVKGLKDSMKACTNEAKHHASAFEKVASAVKRIAFYRMIRSAIKAVTQAMKEGINNLYNYSAALNSLDAARAKNTMDEFATTALYVKNSIGAALMPILQSLLPVVNAIADAFIWAANAVNQLFHALKGEATFTRAKRYAVEYEGALQGAGRAAKELKKQVFGFDELNIFSAPSGGGGGGSALPDYSKMFEETAVSDMWGKITELVKQNLAAIEVIVGGAALAVGAILALSGVNIPLGIALVAAGALSIAAGAGVNWNTFGSTIKQKIGFISTIVGGAVLALGAIMALSGVNIPLGIGLMAAGAVGLAAGLTMNDELRNYIKEKVSEIAVLVGGALLFLGAVVAFGGNVPLGLGLLVAGAASLAAGLAMNNELRDKIKGHLAEITAVVGAALLALGIMVALTGNFPLGLGLLVAGVVAMAVGTTAMNDDLKKEIKSKLDDIAMIVGLSLTALGGILLFANPVLGIPLLIAGLGLVGSQIDWDYLNKKVQAAWEKVKETGRNIKKDLLGWWESIKSFFKGIVDFNASVTLTPSMQNGQNTPSNAGYFAEGGQPQVGSLFWAGEAGAELVGQVGGRTTVTTHDQFSEGMADIMDNTNTVILQAAQTLIQAINSKDMTAVVNVGDRQIVSAYDRGKRLAGSALVL